ncbi:MAG: hypothetical protein M3I20_00405 [Mogibacterium diversum]|jgi:hypothetical protein|uniref:hypothetical protein n=1 Tax=Mogibacterium diversum TaxID=114527 RepID=UPI001CB57424|nr:hypothetical protein [Mogibacterium diversum]MBF1337874.1 hypothetical protein [Mogibacterium diversum]MBF1360778.1 hypothetical protein [Mogibacterium diversum]UQF81489.1 MAG: hypothetical protein M3I20_00405 [Mogibacterium diversum]
MKNFTEEEIRGKLREFENKHDELEYLKRKTDDYIEEDYYFISSKMESNEQIRYELCDQKDLEVLNIMDDNHNLLRMAYMNNYRNEDEVKNTVQREHRRLFNEEDRLYQQLIIAKEAEKQDNR